MNKITDKPFILDGRHRPLNDCGVAIQRGPATPQYIRAENTLHAFLVQLSIFGDDRQNLSEVPNFVIEAVHNCFFVRIPTPPEDIARAIALCYDLGFSLERHPFQLYSESSTAKCTENELRRMLANTLSREEEDIAIPLHEMLGLVWTAGYWLKQQ